MNRHSSQQITSMIGIESQRCTFQVLQFAAIDSMRILYRSLSDYLHRSAYIGFFTPAEFTLDCHPGVLTPDGYPWTVNSGLLTQEPFFAPGPTVPELLATGSFSFVPFSPGPFAPGLFATGPFSFEPFSPGPFAPGLFAAGPFAPGPLAPSTFIPGRIRTGKFFPARQYSLAEFLFLDFLSFFFFFLIFV